MAFGFRISSRGCPVWALANPRSTDMKALTLAALALLLALSMAGTAAAQCDPAFVGTQGKTVTVTPTGGGNDTPNLQCALNLGAAMGPGADVQLEAGSFYTEQLVIRDFRGRIEGMGQGITVIHSPDHPLPIDRPCIAGGACFVDELPSETNRYPSLVSLLTGDVTMTDLSIVVSGGKGTARWELWGGRMELLSNVLQVMGSAGSYRLERITLDAGTITGGAVNRGDAANAVMMWSFAQPTFVTGSSLLLSDSTLRGASGIFTYQIEDSRVFIRHTRFEVSGLRIAIGDTRRSTVMIEGNEIGGLGTTQKGTGVGLVAGNLGTGVHDSSVWIANNVFYNDMRAVNVMLTANLVTNVKCDVVNNDVSGAAVPYQFNGYPCMVVGGQ
jgi:hypothetical protein